MYGQLGHGNTEDQFYPKLVEKLKKKVSSCNYSETFVEISL